MWEWSPISVGFTQSSHFKRKILEDAILYYPGPLWGAHGSVLNQHLMLEFIHITQCPPFPPLQIKTMWLPLPSLYYTSTFVCSYICLTADASPCREKSEYQVCSLHLFSGNLFQILNRILWELSKRLKKKRCMGILVRHSIIFYFPLFAHPTKAVYSFFKIFYWIYACST